MCRLDSNAKGISRSQTLAPKCLHNLNSDCPFQVKIHYCIEGDTTVVSTIGANVATIDFIMRGLPGQPPSMCI